MVVHGALDDAASGEAVEVSTLGRFEVIGPRAGGAAAAGRPLTLLKLLVALGGRTVPASHVSDTLWPDADGYDAHRSLITNLQRLRRIVGNRAVVLKDGRLSLDSDHLRVDALRLPRHLDEIAEASEPQPILQHAKAVLALYRGRFLPGEFDPPEIISTRTRLHTRVINGIAAATERLIRYGRTDDAIDLLLGALAIDDRSEVLYRQLMLAYARSARWSDGIEAYERCCEVLRESHGVGPSSETAQLYRTLLSRGGVTMGVASSDAVPDATDGAHDEQRQVTVALIATASPWPARTVSDSGAAATSAVPGRIEEIVARHGGAVHDSADESVLAVFGAPVAHEDDSVRAVRACWTVVHGAPENPVPANRGGGLPPVRCAIVSGLTVARPARDHLRIDEASLREVRRLLAQAGPAQVVVGQVTRSLVADYFVSRPVRRTDDAESPPAYRVVGETGVDSHFAASKARGLAPFLGRQDEIAALSRKLERAAAGEGAIAAVSGEPGIGKSRLLHEFVVGVDPREVAVVEAGCRAYGDRTPYYPFIQVVRGLLELDATAPAEHQARGVVERIHAIDPGLARFVPYYQLLLSLPQSRSRDAAPLATGAVLRRTMKEAIGALVVQASLTRTLLLVLEDWHWADDSSDDVLRYLQALVPSRRVLIAISHRAASPLHGLDAARLDPVRLGPLADDDSIELVRYMLGTSGIPERLARLVHVRSGGNPFFIEEICHGLRQDAGAEAPGARPPEDVTIPATVQGMIRSRLDGLDRGAREAALGAAVLGRDFTLRLLLEVHGNNEALEDDLDRLKARDLIHQTGVVPEVEYRFKHALTQVVAYEALPARRRRALHERAGHAIERLYAERLDEHFEALARHFAAAQDVDRAVEYLERAGDKAARASASASAAAHYQHAIELLDAREQTPQTMRRRIDLSSKWAGVSYYVFVRDSLEILGRSLALAKRLDDAGRESRVRYWMGRVNHVIGNSRDALFCFREALARLPARRSREIAPVIHAGIGRAAFLAGDFSAAARELELGLAGLDPERDAEETRYSMSFLGLTLAQQGRFEESFAAQEESLRLARDAGDVAFEASNLMRVAISHVLKGDWRAAIAVAHEAADTAERSETPITAAFTAFTEGQARFMLGESAAGLAQCERGLRMVEDSGSHLGFSYFLSVLAELHALAGDYDRANGLAERALVHGRGGNGLGLWNAHRTLALVAEHRMPDRPQVAQSRLAHAHRLATAGTAWPAVAIGRLRRAEVFLRRGAPDRAAAPAQEAIDRFASMGMTWWLDQAQQLEAELHDARGNRRAARRA